MGCRCCSDGCGLWDLGCLGGDFEVYGLYLEGWNGSRVLALYIGGGNCTIQMGLADGQLQLNFVEAPCAG